MDIILILIILIRAVPVVAHVSLTLVNDALLGKPFTLKCKTSVASGTVYLYEPSRLAGSCELNGKCDSGLGYALSQQMSTLEITITIPTANRSTHEGSWKCSDKFEEASLSIKVLTIPQRVVLEGLSSDIQYKDKENIELLIACSCDCAYPNVWFEFTYMNSENNESLYSVNKTGEISTSVICNNVGEHAYKYSMLIKKVEDSAYATEKPLRIKCSVYVQSMLYTNLPYAVSKGIISFPVTPNKEKSSLSGGEIAGIIIGILIFITVAIVITILCIIQVRKRSRRNKYKAKSNTQNRNPGEDNQNNQDNQNNPSNISNAVVGYGGQNTQPFSLSYAKSRMDHGDAVEFELHPSGALKKIRYEKGSTQRYQQEVSAIEH